MPGARARGIAIVACVITWALALVTPREAHAFCGFYVSGTNVPLFNDASQVVMMREGQRTILAMQNNYQGPPEDFAMVVPVPVVLKKDDVKTLSRQLFERVDSLGAPRLVEYWEQDPCGFGGPSGLEGIGGLGHGAGTGTGAGIGSGKGVKVEARFDVGEYQIVILSADDAASLERWLKDNKYALPAGAEPYLRPYVQSGSKFFVAKVDAQKVKFDHGRAMLSPLRFHYDSDRFTLPIRLGLVSSQGTQDLVVNILARHQRFEVANYANVTIPTNLDVSDGAKAQFGTMYAELFDRTLAKAGRAAVTEYAWDARSCDPCPQPALTEQELLTLGADVLRAAPGEHERPTFGTGFVLTRLHLRYGKSQLGDDLVFRAAPPITGGREVRSGPAGALERGAAPAPFNNFQARYAIRHEWAGTIACEKPRRGVWGPPPTGAKPPPRVATNIASAPRSEGKTLSFFVAGVPELKIAPAGDAGAANREQANDLEAGAANPGESPSSSAPSPAASTPPAPSVAPSPSGTSSSAKPSSCSGCRTASRRMTLSSTSRAAPFALAAVAFAVRRRRAKR